jgi:1,4-alpha-glucan branching enzyme
MSSVRLQFRHATASRVTVAGDFNGWRTASHPLDRDREDLWVLEVNLAPGRYEYKFLVDGRQWWNDPEAPKAPNIWGSETSYLEVP